ncbi:carbon-nitrogen hydrolase family protein [Nostocoides sp. HKS02]|uniref:carbon-nitrogen hydrolase family protein n=1 Tax=Nostocoides sp. HKS02 TaxID=1813880 RepID=UPI0018A7F15F|nr:nitrilase-related carbon-nitrogen hydrolase [Tetrasphaera sp. HKS02]
MSRNTTVSCLTAAPLPFDAATDLEEIVERTVDFWGRRLEDVLPDQPDIIVLPETVDRPSASTFGPERLLEYYHHRGTRVRDYFAEVARQNGCHIAYSAVMFVDGIGQNCTQILDRSGAVVGDYAKNFLVIDENETLGLSYGQRAQCFDLDFGRVGSAICFDLNFDEVRTAYVQAKPELLLFSSEYHGGLMQNYWAYSLRAYLAACVRPPAPSAILSPLGEVVATSTNYFEHVTQTVNLDYAILHLDGHWTKLADIKRKYGPGVGIHDPGRLGPVLLTSESNDFSVTDIVAEFDLELLDDYLARARRHRAEHL